VIERRAIGTLGEMSEPRAFEQGVEERGRRATGRQGDEAVVAAHGVAERAPLVFR